ncbi:Adenylate cyclase type 1 [Takifugu flavidus]|uniref:Adenylate cyclase type 1 n=1 Tax=Takifugu flavidus TaxID=433684 RepID=A0A5C6MVV8_9TELE|nr:Adenylate cyclase type 1 [Takifugu flavidus]
MNGPDMEQPPLERVKTRRRKGRCPAGARLRAAACGDAFRSPEVEALFQSYNLKLEQTATLKALAVLIVAASSLSVAELLSSPRLALAQGSCPVHCVVFLSLFIVTNVKFLHVTQLQQIAKLALLFSFTFALLCCPFPLALGAHEPVSAVAPEQGMWQLMLVTLVAYVLLPVRTLLAVVFGATLAASHSVVIATSLAGREPRLWRAVSGGGGGRWAQRGRAEWEGRWAEGGADGHRGGGQMGRGAVRGRADGQRGGQMGTEGGQMGRVGGQMGRWAQRGRADGHRGGGQMGRGAGQMGRGGGQMGTEGEGRWAEGEGRWAQRGRADGHRGAGQMGRGGGQMGRWAEGEGRWAQRGRADGQRGRADGQRGRADGHRGGGQMGRGGGQMGTEGEGRWAQRGRADGQRGRADGQRGGGQMGTEGQGRWAEGEGRWAERGRADGQRGRADDSEFRRKSLFLPECACTAVKYYKD